MAFLARALGGLDLVWGGDILTALDLPPAAMLIAVFLDFCPLSSTTTTTTGTTTAGTSPNIGNNTNDDYYAMSTPGGTTPGGGNGGATSDYLNYGADYDDDDPNLAFSASATPVSPYVGGDGDVAPHQDDDGQHQ